MANRPPVPLGKIDGQSMRVFLNLYKHKRSRSGEQRPMSTILVGNHDSLPGSGSESIFRTRASQLTGGSVPLRKDSTVPKQEYIMHVRLCPKGTYSHFPEYLSGRKGNTHIFGRLFGRESELTLTPGDTKCQNDPSVTLTVIGSKSLCLHSW